jgi:hypothetical protein
MHKAFEEVFFIHGKWNGMEVSKDKNMALRV